MNYQPVENVKYVQQLWYFDPELKTYQDIGFKIFYKNGTGLTLFFDEEKNRDYAEKIVDYDLLLACDGKDSIFR